MSSFLVSSIAAIVASPKALWLGRRLVHSTPGAARIVLGSLQKTHLWFSCSSLLITI